MSIWDTPTTDALLDERQKAGEVPFIGQVQIKRQVEPFIDGEKFPHLLLTGDPGLGKTQFAKWVAWRRQKPFYERLAPVKPQDLPVYGIMLLDEVHRQSNVEGLFPVMDQGILSIVAATTKPEKLDSAFKSRFLLHLRLNRYSLAEMKDIIRVMGGPDAPVDVDVLANASMGHPRTAELIVRTAQGLGTWDPETVLRSCRITADGLTGDHMDFLAALKRVNRPVGRGQVAELTHLTSDACGRIERDLLGMNLIDLSPQGRKLTVRGEQYVKMLEAEEVI